MLRSLAENLRHEGSFSHADSKLSIRLSRKLEAMLESFIGGYNLAVETAIGTKLSIACTRLSTAIMLALLSRAWACISPC